MTDRELRLRERLDRVTDQRDWYRARAKQRKSRCIYCGEPTWTYQPPPVCRNHLDILRLDRGSDVVARLAPRGAQRDADAA